MNLNAIQLSNKIKENKNTIRNLKIENIQNRKILQKLIAKEFPLSSLQGHKCAYTKATWGSTNIDILNHDYHYMMPYDIVKGTDLTESVLEEIGRADDDFVIYVSLEQGSSMDEEYPEVWEYLFVKIKED